MHGVVAKVAQSFFYCLLVNCDCHVTTMFKNMVLISLLFSSDVITTMEGASLVRRILIRCAEFVSPWVASHATGKKGAEPGGSEAKPRFSG